MQGVEFETDVKNIYIYIYIYFDLKAYSPTHENRIILIIIQFIRFLLLLFQFKGWTSRQQLAGPTL